MYIHNLDIPGYATKERLDILAKHAADVPDNGWIVEYGAFAGRTTYTLAMNSHPSVKTTSIDSFSGNNIFINNQESILGTIRPTDRNDIKTWKHYTKGCKNLDYLQVKFPIMSDEFIFRRKANLIYFDADHRYKRVKEDLNYFYSMLANGGVMLIDDYNPKSWPGVVRAVNEFATKHQLDFDLVDSTCARIVK